MDKKRQLFWELIGWVVGIAWLAGFMAGTWLDRGTNYLQLLQLFGVVQFTAFSILAAWSLTREVGDHSK